MPRRMPTVKSVSSVAAATMFQPKYQLEVDECVMVIKLPGCPRVVCLCAP